MTHRLLMSVALTVFFALASPAGAQMWPPVGAQALTADDLARMHAAAAQLYG